MSIQSTTLPTGLRVITDSVPTVESVALGIWCDVGTRHENMAHNGVAHMVEHMMFNGTSTRTAQDIVSQIETVGGQMNAFTSREITAYYVHLLKDHTEMAVDILSDMLQRSTFPDAEIEKERGVIVQEIGMTNDTPDDLVFDFYQETAYPNQSLGAPILGTAQIVQGMTKQTMVDYVSQFYTPSKLVISASGNLDHDQFVAMVEKYFTDLPDDKTQELKAAAYQGGESRTEKDLEQSHIVFGFKSIEKSHDKYYAAVLLATILGGGMSSRLFQEVREKRGLVYSTYASHTSFVDEGQFEIYAGTGPDKLPELMPVICDELKKIRDIKVSDEELSRAKAQIKSSILMSRESMLSRVNRQAKYLINTNTNLDIQLLIQKIDAITVRDIQGMALHIFAEKPTLSALGPLAALEDFDKIQARLAA